MQGNALTITTERQNLAVSSGDIEMSCTVEWNSNEEFSVLTTPVNLFKTQGNQDDAAVENWLKLGTIGSNTNVNKLFSNTALQKTPFLGLENHFNATFAQVVDGSSKKATVTVQIKRVKEEDAGIYTCGVNSGEIVMKVIMDLFTKTSVSTMLRGYPDSSNQGAMDDSDQLMFNEGQNGFLECETDLQEPTFQIVYGETGRIIPGDDFMTVSEKSVLNGTQGMRKMSYSHKYHTKNFAAEQDMDGKMLKCTVKSGETKTDSVEKAMDVSYRPFMEEANGCEKMNDGTMLRCRYFSKPSANMVNFNTESQGPKESMAQLVGHNQYEVRIKTADMTGKTVLMLQNNVGEGSYEIEN